MGEEGPDGFDFVLAVDNHPEAEEEECFVVTARIWVGRQIHSEVVSSFSTIEQAEGCFEAHEKTAKKHKMVCVERTPIPEESGQWASESKWRRRHPVCS